jgi:P4 family phage/plasmid primase-like protien
MKGMFQNWLLGDARLNIIPILPNEKRPAVEWKRYQNERYPSEGLKGWKGNFAVVCGRSSSNLVVLDVEDPKLYERFLKDIDTLTVKTPRGGVHLYFFTGMTVRKIPKFLGYPIDVQGEGSYVLIPPSKLNGKPYQIIKDRLIKFAPSLDFIKAKLPRVVRSRGIKEFKSRIDITQIVERYVTKRYEGKGYWQGNCPFHHDEHPSFTVYQDHFFCFGCGAHGDVIDFIQRAERMNLLDAIRRLEELTGERYFEKFIGSKKKRAKEPIKPHEVADLLMTVYHFKTMRDTEEVLVYHDGVYEFGGEVLVKAETQRIMRQEGECERCTTHFVNEVIGHVRRSTFIDRREFEADPWLVAVQNGILNIQTHELLPHSPERTILVRIPVRYDPNADCPRIGQFFQEVVRSEDIVVLEEIFGYCLYKSYPIQKAVLFVGERDNGKSTTLRLLEAFLGKHNCSGVPLHELLTNRFAPAELYGKLANTFADLPSGALRSTGMFKALTGGDLIKGERKFKDPFYFYNYAKLLFSANRAPPTEDRSGAFFKRWLIVDFPNVFEGEKRDSNILEKLTTPTELSGLLNLALKALKRLLERGDFSRTETVDAIARRYERLSDQVAAFIADRCETGPDKVVEKSRLYNAFVEYCREVQVPVLSQRAFTERLRRTALVEDFRPKPTAKRCWKGIGLKTGESVQLRLDE